MKKEEKPVLNQIHDEIYYGAFSVLGDRALGRLFDLARWAMQDGYDRGLKDGRKK